MSFRPILMSTQDVDHRNVTNKAWSTAARCEGGCFNAPLLPRHPLAPLVHHPRRAVGVPGDEPPFAHDDGRPRAGHLFVGGDFRFAGTNFSPLFAQASIDAKRFGVRTGTPVWQARKLCKDMVFVQARPSTYVEIHHRIVAAVESCTPVSDVLSIDEMACDLMGSDREEANAIRLGQQIKQAIYDQVGEVLHSSVGIAPNRFLAKTASNMQKPDGLTVLAETDVCSRIWPMATRKLLGVGPKTEAHLRAMGIDTIGQIAALSLEQLTEEFGQSYGLYLYDASRGIDDSPIVTH